MKAGHACIGSRFAGTWTVDLVLLTPRPWRSVAHFGVAGVAGRGDSEDDCSDDSRISRESTLVECNL